jgi:hypothetical protein
MMLVVCEFDDDDREKAKTQAKAQQGDTENKKKGNLGEIAFDKFCDQRLSTEYEWKNRDAVNDGRSEKAPYDFKISVANIDVKTRTDITEFRPRTFDYRTNVEEDTKTHAYVFILLNFDKNHATILGWESHSNLTTKLDWSPKKRREKEQDVPMSTILFRDIQELPPWSMI